ncbi:MAG: hypothetical protein MUF22_08430 [Chitinispirillaceae bacterium]|nr:hypothetical protein [Chitinispirillaceae bacterium]
MKVASFHGIMKLSYLRSFLEEQVTVNDFTRFLESEMAGFGSTRVYVSEQLVEDVQFRLDEAGLCRVLGHYLAGELSETHLVYVCSLLTRTPFVFYSDDVAAVVDEFANTAFSGPLKMATVLEVRFTLHGRSAKQV